MNKPDEGLMNYMLSSAYQLHKDKLETPQKEVIDDLTESQALTVSNEILQVLIDNNVSYKNAYRICLALTYALASGGVELYNEENK